MTRTPTARERRILYESGRWDVVELLTETDDAIKRAKSRSRGQSDFTIDEESFVRFDTARGIELHRRDADDRYHPGSPADEVVTWSTVRAIAATVPDDLRQRLADHRLRSRRHQADYPLFAASKAAQGCGNPWAWVRPLTEAQALYEAEWDAYCTGLLAAWRAKRTWLDDECELLLAAALLLPVTVDQEGLW